MKETPTSGAYAVPKQWTHDVINKYEPVKELGRGGFAVVMLARQKVAVFENMPEELVAIKVVGSSRANIQEQAYALRETEILKELSHPNIVKIYDDWKIPKGKGGGVAIMALSYENGPTLLQILKNGGCVSINFCRVVSAQLIDAIAYMHSRACVHRDIKPDNIIIVGACENDADIWNDPSDVNIDIIPLRYRWTVKVIDFGLARALTKEDFQKPHPTKPFISLDSDRSLTRSRHFIRKLSAVGNSTYAAPEILSGISNDSSFKLRRNLRQVDGVYEYTIDVNENQSEYVAFYGLMADAYSIGITIRYMFTGVSTKQNVDEAIEFERNPVVLLIKLLSSCTRKKSIDSPTNFRPVRYRRISQIPNTALQFMKGMIHPDPSLRTTVSQARIDPWIDKALIDYQPIDRSYIHYLPTITKTRKYASNDDVH